MKLEDRRLYDEEDLTENFKEKFEEKVKKELNRIKN